VFSVFVVFSRWMILLLVLSLAVATAVESVARALRASWNVDAKSAPLTPRFFLTADHSLQPDTFVLRSAWPTACGLIKNAEVKKELPSQHTSRRFCPDRAT